MGKSLSPPVTTRRLIRDVARLRPSDLAGEPSSLTLTQRRRLRLPHCKGKSGSGGAALRGAPLCSFDSFSICTKEAPSLRLVSSKRQPQNALLPLQDLIFLPRDSGKRPKETALQISSLFPSRKTDDNAGFQGKADGRAEEGLREEQLQNLTHPVLSPPLLPLLLAWLVRVPTSHISARD